MIQQISEDRVWSQIVAKAWCDEEVMSRLLSDPRAVLAENGLDVPYGMDIEVVKGSEVHVVENGDTIQFILPDGPSEELMDEELVGDAVDWYCAASGACYRCGCRCYC